MSNTKRSWLSLTLYRGITVNVVPITAVSPRLVRYSRIPHYRADLYCEMWFIYGEVAAAVDIFSMFSAALEQHEYSTWHSACNPD